MTVRIAAVVALQTLALCWMIADRFWLLEYGREATFKVVPVDPRDFFRGDFVVLSFPFSTVELDKLGAGNLDLKRGETVYVTLAPDAGAGWRAAAIARTAPERKGDGALFLKGAVDGAWRTSYDNPLPPECPNGCPHVSVRYGIESFFVPFGQGRPIEDERNKDRVELIVSVDEGGRAGIKALKVGGETVYAETLF